MRLGRRLRELGLWWRGIYPPARVVLVVMVVLLLSPAVVLPLVLRPGAEVPPPAPGRPSLPTATGGGSSALLLDDGRLLYEPGWGTLEVRHYLAGRPGTLGTLRLWVGDREMPVADVIAGKCLLYGLNSKVMLALLELQSGLVDNPHPSPESLDWAMGYHDEGKRGLEAQLDWAARELFRSTRDYLQVEGILLGDGISVTLPASTNMGSYAVMRVVGPAGDEARFRRLLGTGEDSFVETYRRLFGEDPRRPPENLPLPAIRPFLTQPYQGTFEVTAIFDHHYPFLYEDGTLISFLGQEAAGLAYDGHDGWDYALDAGVPVLAAADGLVIWAGNSNDGCDSVAQGVILDHGNGFQTLYWHLSQIEVTVGRQVRQGERLGLAGASGCADGPHLHFAVHFLGRRTDPEGWCGAGEDPWAKHPAGLASPWLWADRFSPCRPPAGSVLVDDSDTGFQQSGDEWREDPGGVGGKARWAATKIRSGVVAPGNPGQLDGIIEGATWRPDLPHEGRYRVYAFVPLWNNGTPDTQAARYLVRHAEGENLVMVNQSLYVNRWVDLGTYRFPAGRQGFVYLDNLTDEVGFCVWFDAVVWVPE